MVMVTRIDPAKWDWLMNKEMEGRTVLGSCPNNCYGINATPPRTVLKLLPVKRPSWGGGPAHCLKAYPAGFSQSVGHGGALYLSVPGMPSHVPWWVVKAWPPPLSLAKRGSMCIRSTIRPRSDTTVPAASSAREKQSAALRTSCRMKEAALGKV